MSQTQNIPTDGRLVCLHCRSANRQELVYSSSTLGQCQYVPLLISRLEPFAPALKKRYDAYRERLDQIDKYEGGLATFSEGYKSMGFQVDEKGGVRYREWAPNAVEARLIGDFSEWISVLRAEHR